MVDQRGGSGIGLGLARETDERPQPALDGERVDQLELRGAETMRKVHDDLPDVSQIGLASRRSRLPLARHRARRSSAASWPRIDRRETRASSPCDCGGEASRAHRHRIVRARRETRPLRPRWCALPPPAREEPDDRRAPGAPARRTASSSGLRPAAAKRTRAQQLGETVEHHEADIDDAAGTPSELAAERQPRQVARHDDRDRRERVAAFGCGDDLQASASVAARPNGTVVSRATPPRSMTQR